MVLTYVPPTRRDDARALLCVVRTRLVSALEPLREPLNRSNSCKRLSGSSCITPTLLETPPILCPDVAGLSLGTKVLVAGDECHLTCAERDGDRGLVSGRQGLSPKGASLVTPRTEAVCFRESRQSGLPCAFSAVSLLLLRFKPSSSLITRFRIPPIWELLRSRAVWVVEAYSSQTPARYGRGDRWFEIFPAAARQASTLFETVLDRLGTSHQSRVEALGHRLQRPDVGGSKRLPTGSFATTRCPVVLKSALRRPSDLSNDNCAERNVSISEG